ncbi:MAG: aminoacyl-histidine dipeptidase, partial [Lachnospiraceae bacterium]|nr:aminoacyl-histidine dipeptidase [Lachnospiraceae bacterium]
MGVLSGLEPKEVFHYFEEICGIPHPSYKEKQISDYCVKFAKERGLEHYQDELGNVIIIKEATPGYESVEPLI